MISTFLDCAPVIFSPTSNTPGSELALVTAMVEITRSLYGEIFRDSTSVSAYFSLSGLQLTMQLPEQARHGPGGPQNVIRVYDVLLPVQT